MAVRVTEEDGTDGVTGPGTSGFRERHEGDQAGKNPDVGCGGDDGTFAEAVTRLARARRRRVGSKIRFNRVVRGLVQVPALVGLASLGAKIAPALIDKAVAYAGDVR